MRGSLLRSLARFVAVSALVSAVDVPLAAAAPPSAKGRITLLGSSSVNDAFGDTIVESLERDGYKVVRRGYPSAGLSRPDFRDMFAEVAKVPLVAGSTTLLLYLGGNDAQPLWLPPNERSGGRDAWVKWEDERWSGIYEQRARRIIDAACARGARRVVVLAPADVVGHKLQQRLERVRTLQERAAASSKCGRFVTTSGDAGQLETRTPALRDARGVHMTHAGALRVWDRIGKRVLELITAPAQS